MASPREDLEYDSKMSVSYHRKREHFYRSVDALGKALSLIALVSIGLQISWLTIAIAVLSGALTITTIVLDCAGMAARHGGLAARFATLLSKVAAAEDDGIKALRKEYHIIEADEPPSIRGLVQLCQDEQDAALGDAVDPQCFSIWRKIKAQLGLGDRSIDWV